MVRLSKKLLVVSLSALLFGGCTAGQKKTELDQQVHAQVPANTPEEISQRAAESFSGAPGLSVEQKQKLMRIYSKVYVEAMSIRTEIGQSKSLLFQMIASTSYNSEDVRQLKKKITGLDQQRLALMFQALEDVQKVVGFGADKQDIYKHLRDFEFPSRGHTALDQ